MTKEEAVTKATEKRLRRRLDKYDLKLVKSRCRTPHDLDYGMYAIFDIRTGGPVHALNAVNSPFALSLEQVQWYVDDLE